MENNEKIKESIRLAEEIKETLLGKKETNSPQLRQWREESPEHETLYQEILHQKNLNEEWIFHQNVNTDEALEKVSRRLLKSKRSSMNSSRFIKRISIAATLLFAVAGTSLYLMNREYRPEHQEEEQAEFYAAIHPGHTQASFSNEEKKQSITLQQNQLAIQAGQLICQASDGSVIFKMELNSNEKLNKLSVPKGGEYHIVLEDGSQIALNSDSELLFPTHFDTQSRNVYLRGEAFFRVAHNEQKAFHVQTEQLNIEVTGTTFNVNAYPNENAQKVTLTEGSVRVSNKGGDPYQLVPGEQYTYLLSEKTQHVAQVDSIEQTAWTKGKFIFNNTPLPEITQQLSRWYDVDFTLNPSVKALRFTGTISRKENINDVLEILRLTQEVEFVAKKGKNIEAINKTDTTNEY